MLPIAALLVGLIAASAPASALPWTKANATHEIRQLPGATCPSGANNAYLYSDPTTGYTYNVCPNSDYPVYSYQVIPNVMKITDCVSLCAQSSATCGNAVYDHIYYYCHFKGTLGPAVAWTTSTQFDTIYPASAAAVASLVSSQSASRSVSQSASLSASKSASQAASLSMSQSASQSASLSAFQSASRLASLAASQSASQQAAQGASQQASLAASQTASQQASQQASLAASQSASQQAAQGASQQASLAASQTASQQASLAASQAASQQAVQQASQQASLAASQTASQQASLAASSLAASQQASRNASLAASQTASQQASQSASQSASLAASQAASQQAALQGALAASQAASQQASQAASLAASQTAAQQASQQASLSASQSASQQASLAASQQASQAASLAASQQASQQAGIAASQTASAQAASSLAASQAASSQAASLAASQAASRVVSQSASQSASLAASQAYSSQIAASLVASQAASSQAASLAASQMASQTASQAASLTASQIASSQAASRAASQSVSASVSLSQSNSASAAAAAATLAASKAAATAMPSGWTSMNNRYIAEGNNGRALTGSSYSDGTNMTWTSCINFCASGGYPLAGIEYASQCFCGYVLSNGASALVNGTTDPMACSGTPYATCGGPNALSLFALQSNLPTYSDATLQTVNPVLPAGWSVASTSCLQEGNSGRALTGATLASGNNMTIPNCIAFCDAAGFTYAGMEYASECYCGNSLSNGASLSISSQQCNMGCSGQPATICGGPGALSLYYSAANAQTNSPAAQASSLGLPSGWTPSACIQEVNGHALTGSLSTTGNMTPGQCASTCAAEGFTMAGLEFGNQCYCGNSLANGASLNSVSNQCTTPCAGNSTLKCGGQQAVLILSGTTTAPIQVQGYNLTGCVQDGSNHALTGSYMTDPAMTTEMCISYCSKGGFQYAGLEYNNQCYCGNTFVNGFSATSQSTNCVTPCAGNSGQTCGGGWAMTLWTGTPANTVSPTPARVNGYTYQGCVAEGSGGRALTGTSTWSSSMTIDMCTSFCSNAGYQYAGLEYTSECYCGNSFSNGASLTATSNNCNMQCGGNSGQVCGGPGALTVYSGAPPAPTFPQNPSTVSGYNFVGCLADGGARTLSGAYSANNTMTIPSCVAFCKNGGFKYAGIEYGSECFCDNSLGGGRTATSYSYSCNMPCSGDSSTICGGSWALQVYGS